MEEVAVFRAWEQVGQILIFASQPSFAEVVSHTRLGWGESVKFKEEIPAVLEFSQGHTLK